MKSLIKNNEWFRFFIICIIILYLVNNYKCLISGIYSVKVIKFILKKSNENEIKMKYEENYSEFLFNKKE